ncbi:MAG: methyltransferase domain-containing protein [Acidimicrobiia bacterium]
MLLRVIDVLACPWCGAGVRHVSGHVEQPHGVLTNGELACVACGRVSEVVDGIWRAMGPWKVARTAAQISNVVPPTPQLYERVWRHRSLTMLSGRTFPLREELAEMRRGAGIDALADGDIVADIACSEGLYSREVASSGAGSGPAITVLAVDHSEAFLRRVVQRAKREKLAIVAVRASAQHLPIRAASLGAVVMGGSLNEIGDCQAAIGEMGRACRPGGHVFSMSLVRAGTARGRVLQRLARGGGIVFPTETETVSMFERAGLEITDRRRDRVVLRLSATRSTGVDGAAGSGPADAA